MGIVLKSFRQINEGVGRLLEPPTFAELSANASAYKNNALFEIPEFLEEIAERKEPRTGGLGSPVSKRNMLEQVAWSSLTSRLEASYPT
jgi:hypothetical protein